MSIFKPADGWFKAPKGTEALWLGVALVWCLIMFIAMPFWHYKGKQTSSGESYRVTKKAFIERVERFIKTYKVGTDKSGMAIVAPPPGGNAYLLGHNWQWKPILKLKKGVSYRLHISSGDYQHGFSLVPMNINFHVLPEYDHVLTIKPTKVGDYQIICNEYCGLAHHLMIGKIIVE